MIPVRLLEDGDKNVFGGRTSTTVNVATCPSVPGSPNVICPVEPGTGS